MKKCPMCAEEIQDAAIKCKHCGAMLKNKEMEEEKVLVLEHPSHERYTLHYLFSATMLLVSFSEKSPSMFIFVMAMIMSIFYIRSSVVYTITDRRIKVVTGILGRREAEINIEHIRDVILHKGFYSGERFGQIMIRSSSTNFGGILLDGIRWPRKRVELIRGLQEKYHS